MRGRSRRRSWGCKQCAGWHSWPSRPPLHPVAPHLVGPAAGQWLRQSRPLSQQLPTESWSGEKTTGIPERWAEPNGNQPCQIELRYYGLRHQHSGRRIPSAGGSRRRPRRRAEGHGGDASVHRRRPDRRWGETCAHKLCCFISLLSPPPLVSMADLLSDLTAVCRTFVRLSWPRCAGQ